MHSGSHSRHSHQLDKLVPISAIKSLSSLQKKVIKKMHNKKQRQHNEKLKLEEEEENKNGTNQIQ